ncbi:hypothetical protein FJT64_012203 [Amphibalanus amphitrite]|uniref:Mab-21-like HhH/H2TH-like domain-containing protein n=1 Tax=Amphibalanus amphitrite TaxID=1232801 RepID=A0A6A4V787_AMPAM|nr:hypothetical protein FJT64_012203 [Amphibalanus amphitrite]
MCETARAWLAGRPDPAALLPPDALVAAALQLPYITVNRGHEPAIATLDDTVERVACLLLGGRRPPVPLRPVEPPGGCVCQRLPALAVRRVLLSGSSRECSQVLLIDGETKSDLDVMFELAGADVCWPGEAEVPPEPGSTRLWVRRTEQEGFVLLEFEQHAECRHRERRLFSAAVARDLLRAHPALFGGREPGRAGPASTTAVRPYLPYPCDLLVCLPLRRWPSEEYGARRRPADWPPPGLVRALCATPALLVPVGCTPQEEHQWRLSFSRHEYAVYRALTDRQRDCFELKSYYLKTALLWLAERRPPGDWEDVYGSMLAVLTLVAEAAGQRRLSCYFNAEMNVLTGRTEAELTELAESAASLAGRLTSCLAALTASCLQRFTVEQLLERLLPPAPAPPLDVSRELAEGCRAPMVEPDHGADILLLCWLDRAENVEPGDPINFRRRGLCLPGLRDRWLVGEMEEE